MRLKLNQVQDLVVYRLVVEVRFTRRQKETAERKKKSSGTLLVVAIREIQLYVHHTGTSIGRESWVRGKKKLIAVFSGLSDDYRDGIARLSTAIWIPDLRGGHTTALSLPPRVNECEKYRGHVRASLSLLARVAAVNEFYWE